MDNFDDIQRLRDEYEASMDEVEEKRAEYHRAIRKLNLSGVPLREIAESLGLSHQRVHQIVNGEAAPKRARGRGRKAALGVVAALLFVSGATGIGYEIQNGHRVPTRSLASSAGTPTRPTRETGSMACRSAGAPNTSGLPAPVLVSTKCGNYTVLRSGRVVVAPPPAPWSPPGLTQYADSWGVAAADGRLELYGGGLWTSGPRPPWRVVWRSAGSQGADPSAVTSVAIGPQAVAFSLGNGRLYVAPEGVGEQHLVAHREWAVGWTARGDLITRTGTTFRLRGTDGHLIRTFLHGAHISSFDQETGMLLYVDAAGRLQATDGRATMRLATGRVVGDTRGMSIEETGHLIELLALRHLVVLHRDGAFFASANIPSSSRITSAGVAVDPAGTAVAYTLAAAPPSSGDHPEHVLMLRRGATSPDLVATSVADLSACERVAQLAWHGRWLLYASNHQLLIDTAGPLQPPIDLTSVLHRLSVPPGAVSWAPASA